MKKIKHILKNLFFGQIDQYNKITDIFNIGGKFVSIKQTSTSTISNIHGEQTIFIN